MQSFSPNATFYFYFYFYGQTVEPGVALRNEGD